MEQDFERLGKKEPLTERYAALETFEKVADAPGGRRYRIVATLAIVLASADLQRSVRRQRWRAFAREVLERAEAELAAEEAAEAEAERRAKADAAPATSAAE